MAANTILLDFSVEPGAVKNDNQMQVLATNIENVLRDYLTSLKQVHGLPFQGGLLRLYTADPGVSVFLRIYGNGLITINMEYFKGDKDNPLLTFELSKVLEQKLQVQLASFRSKMFPPIKRGGQLDVYLSSSDERLLEYDIDKVLFEETSPYQKVQIVHSKSLGNILVLDDLQNIGESDLIYTETLMARGKENYEDKEIVILGGGDGALLYELLKEKPKEVIMLEIDEVVMKACAKYMRSICGDVLDKYDGPNYKIIIGDCMKYLEEFMKEGRKFDYIFGDLTDVPISQKLSGQLWTFYQKVLQMCFKLLRQDGKFMTHVNGICSSESVDMFKSQLDNIEPPVKFTTSRAFVPSFMEDWIFCQVFFNENKKE